MSNVVKSGTVPEGVGGVYIQCPGCSQMKRGYYDCSCGYDAYRRAEQGVSPAQALPPPLLSRRDLFLLEIAKKSLEIGRAMDGAGASTVKSYVDFLLREEDIKFLREEDIK